MSKSPKTAPFSMRLDPDLKAQLQALADAEERSLTQYVERALRRLVAEARPKKGKAA
jgi:predicted transcriptional regulator